MASESLGYLAAGAALGLSAGLSPGPLLTLVLAQSLAHGAREGIKIAFSPLFTDTPILIAAILGMSFLSAHPAVMGVVSLTGAAVVAGFALDCFRSRAAVLPDAALRPDSLKKGVLTNFLNPHVYLFWTTVGAPTVILAYESGPLAPALFLGGFYFCLIGSKITLAVFTARFKGFLKSRGYLILMRLLGLALVVFALLFARDGLRFLGIL